MGARPAVDVARDLWIEMNSAVPPYPAGVVPVPEPIERTAFFPAGLGLWMEEAPVSSFEFPIDEIMVVGQDFNTVATYNRARELKSEVNSSRTWQKLLRVFALFNIAVKSCFFTNVYMGLRSGGRETGTFPAHATQGSSTGASASSGDR